jgi:hypothetical protein
MVCASWDVFLFLPVRTVPSLTCSALAVLFAYQQSSQSGKVLANTAKGDAANSPVCWGARSDYRKRRAALGQVVLLVALAFFYLIGWAVSNAVVTLPHPTYPLTLLGTLFITRFR